MKYNIKAYFNTIKEYTISAAGNNIMLKLPLINGTRIVSIFPLEDKYILTSIPNKIKLYESLLPSDNAIGSLPDLIPYDGFISIAISTYEMRKGTMHIILEEIADV